MREDKVLTYYFEGTIKAIHVCIPANVIKVTWECLMRQDANVGGVSENRRKGIYRGV